MRSEILIIDKPIGVTPLEVIKRLQAIYPMYKTETISYAGRLDPMAHGMLLLLVGQENKKREDYLHLDKMYQVEMLFGIETDSYDVLGKVISAKPTPIAQDKIERVLPRFTGQRKQPYPPFSSKPVQGKPLFYWAREGRLKEITIPSKEVTIHSLQFISNRTITGKVLEQEIKEKIQKVSGNFRQKEILSLWEKSVDKNGEYSLVMCSVFCSSGTYVRSITHDMGKYIGYGAIAYDIYRTQVGSFKITDAIRLY